MEITFGHVLFLSILQSAAGFHLVPQFFPTRSLTSIFSIFALFNFTAFAFYHVVFYPFFRSPLRHLPKPPRGFIPLLGHGMNMFKRPPGQAHLNIMKETPNDGIIHVRGLLHADRLLITKPAAFAEVLVHKSYDFEKPPWVRDFLRQFIGNGLLMTEGEEHKHQRKQIMPAFSFRHIKELYPVFWTKSVELCSVIKTELLERQNAVLEVNHYFTLVALDIIGLAGLGRDIGSLRNSADELIQNYEEILEPTAEKGLYFVLHLIFPQWLIKALPWKLNERVHVTTGNLTGICREFVREKKERSKLRGEEEVDILSVMLKSNNFSDDGLADQLLTFLAAGHETTASAFTWASHLLAINPSIQSRLRAEIHENIPDVKALSRSDFDLVGLIDSLQYLNAVCNETLRLYPTIPESARMTMRDTSIDGHFVPKGTICYITPYATNRDPALWGNDSEVFRPERWIDEETGRATNMGGADSNYSFLTFIHGPRSCIGEKFARAELRVLLAAFVGSFEMEMADPNEKVKAGGTITSKPVNGMRLKLHPVKW